MRIPSLLTATILLCSSAWAQHDDDYFYLQFGLGGVLSEDAEGAPGGTVGFDPGFSLSGAFGRSFRLSERLSFDAEFETYYQAFTVDEDDVGQAVEDDATALAFLLNGLVEWYFTPQYSIYAGAGIGWAKNIDYDTFDSGSLRPEDDDGVAYQGRFGLGYNLGGSYDVRLGYRYFKTEPIDIEDELSGQVDEIDVAQHVFEATFRWSL